MFDIFPFIEFKRIMAMFPFMAGIIEIQISVGLASDGSITTGGGASLTYILSASSTSSTWQAVTLTFVLLALVSFLLTIYIASKAN